jgi:hypothetical protein
MTPKSFRYSIFVSRFAQMLLKIIKNLFYLVTSVDKKQTHVLLMLTPQ